MQFPPAHEAPRTEKVESLAPRILEERPGDIAAIGESMVEVLTSPSMKTHTLTLTMPTTVVINRDPLDFQFPATATRYVVSANYGGGSTAYGPESGF